jgi:hypothetical protein
MSDDFSRFEGDLDLFGPEPATWPAEARDRADRLLATDPRATAALATARLLDDALRAPPGPPASAELRARILGAAAARPPASPVRRAGRWMRVGVGSAALAASLLLGFFVGTGDAANAAPAEADAIGLLLGPVSEDDLL